MKLLNLFLPLGLAATNSLCPQSGRNYFYLAPSNFPAPTCSNTHSLGKSPDELIVSTSAVAGLSPLALVEKGDFAWLLRCTATTTAKIGRVLGDGYSLLTFSAANFSDAESLALDCEKQEVSFRQAYIARNTSTIAAIPSFGGSIPDKDAFVGSLDEPETRYMDFLKSLSGNTPLPDKAITLKTRYTGTNDNKLASEWIASWFLEQQLDTYTQVFTAGARGTAYNVIGEMAGTTKPEEIVVVGAHFDSTSQQASTLAPGAVDNGSGAVGIMVLAAAAMNMQFSRTVQFVAFGGEEQGLYGSQHYVSEAQKAKKKIVAALIMDMIGYSNKYYGVKIEGTTNPDIQKLMQLFDANVKSYTQLTRVQSTDSFGSDHVPFQKAGYPAFLAIEQDDTNYPDYHRTTDTVKNVNRGQSVDILKGLAGTIYDLAV